MVAHPDSSRLFSLVPVVVREISEPGKRGLEHGDVDHLSTPGFLPLIQRQKNSRRGIHGGSQIDDRHADFGRLIRVAGGGDDSRFALDQQVVGLDIPIRAILPVAGDGTIDQAWIARTQFRRAQTHAIGYARSKVFQNDVHSIGKAAERFEAGFLLDIHRETSLVAVEPDITGGKTVHGGIPLPDQIAGSQLLQLDDLGSHVSQDPRGMRSGHGDFQGQDLHAGQGQSGLLWLGFL